MTAALVEHLLQGRLGRAPGRPVGELAPDLTLPQAYALQRQLEEALVGRGSALSATRWASPPPRSRSATA